MTPPQSANTGSGDDPDLFFSHLCVAGGYAHIVPTTLKSIRDAREHWVKYFYHRNLLVSDPANRIPDAVTVDLDSEAPHPDLEIFSTNLNGWRAVARYKYLPRFQRRLNDFWQQVRSVFNEKEKTALHLGLILDRGVRPADAFRFDDVSDEAELQHNPDPPGGTVFPSRGSPWKLPPLKGERPVRVGTPTPDDVWLVEVAVAWRAVLGAPLDLEAHLRAVGNRSDRQQVRQELVERLINLCEERCARFDCHLDAVRPVAVVNGTEVNFHRARVLFPILRAFVTLKCRATTSQLLRELKLPYTPHTCGLLWQNLKRLSARFELCVELEISSEDKGVDREYAFRPLGTNRSNRPPRQRSSR